MKPILSPLDLPELPAEQSRLSLETCKNLLCATDIAYSDEEVTIIRDFLYQLAVVSLQEHESTGLGARVISLYQNQPADEKSHYLRAG